MIIYKPGQNIFDSTAHVLINPVNTKGIAGKGLALEFKKRFKNNYNFYHKYCSEISLEGGDLIWYCAENLNERNIINFCTKEDWKKPSKLEWIQKGIVRLVEQFNASYPNGQYPTPLLAVPMLGCGEGGLEQSEVLKIITRSLEGCKFDVEIYTSKLSASPESVEEVSEPE